jgi:hypothetical protein
MLRNSGVRIAESHVIDSALPRKSGSEVAQELGGRYLLRYLSRQQIGQYARGHGGIHWVTPTPYSSRDCMTWLNLPAPDKPRTHALLLDPERIPSIAGPRWIEGGLGIEYMLPDGFPAEALVFEWEWPIG